MNTKLSTLLLSVIFGLTACSVDDTSITPSDNPDDISWEKPDYTSVKCDDPVFISDGIKPEVRSALDTYLTNITSLDEAMVAVVKPEDIGTYEGKLKAFYDRGGLVVVAHPTGKYFAEFSEKYGIFDVMPFDASKPILLFATDNTGMSVTLYDCPPFDGTYSNPDDAEDGPVTEEEVMLPQPVDETAHYRDIIFNFFRRIKQNREQRAAVTRGDTQFVTQFDPKVLITEFTTHSHIFVVPMEHKVYQIHGCSGDYLNVKGSFEVIYSIKPCYLFENNGDNAGDYYIVKADVIARNGQVYKPYYTWHGWRNTLGVVSVAGYYMKNLQLSSTLMSNAQKPVTLSDISFAAQPSPVTTINSSTYTSGIDLGLQGALSVGTKTGLGGSMGFSASYNKSSTINITDLDIEKNTDDQSRQVSYKYVVNNITLDRFDMVKNIFTTMSNDDIVEKFYPTQIPAIARSDFDATSWWCWYVPANTNGVKDKASTQFTIKADLKLTHDSYAYWNTIASSHRSFNYDNNSFTFNIPAPNRQPFGILALANNHNKVVSNIKIYSQENVADKDTLCLSRGYLKGQEAKCALPEGTYIVDYDLKNGDDNTIDSRWRIKNVIITKGVTEEASTAYISTDSAIERNSK